jgi:hypothetical protein
MESVMLEHYYAKPSTIDRIRGSWLGSQIENYVGWMEANGYSSRTVFRRMPRLFCFAEFAQRRGCTDVDSAFALVEDLFRMVGSARTGSKDIGVVAQAWN